MDFDETIDGRPAVTKDQIAAWAADAEEGVDVAERKKRGRGRPGRGIAPSPVLTLRPTREEVAELDARVTRRGTSRAPAQWLLSPRLGLV